MKENRHRVLLVSDAHYTTEETHEELIARFPDANASAAAGKIFGFGQGKKIALLRQAILAEHEKDPLDAVFMLGDLSIDDYPWRNLPDNYIKKFREDCFDGLPFPCHALAGNHDSYPDELWRGVFPEGRQYAVPMGDALFVMLDNYNSPAKSASGSAYTLTDVQFLEKTLAVSDAKRVFLCAHHFSPENESEAFVRLLEREKRIVCLFRGHTHLDGILNPERFGGRYLIDLGGFGGYDGMPIDGKYTFQIFSRAWAWGYEIMEWDDRTVTMYHVKPAYTYHGLNGTFTTQKEIAGRLCFGTEESCL